MGVVDHELISGLDETGGGNCLSKDIVKASFA